MPETLDLDTAAKVFIECFTRATLLRGSGQRLDVGAMPRIRFEIARLGDQLLLDEFIAVGGDARDVVATVRAGSPARRHLITAIGRDRAALITAYAAQGYVPHDHEYLMHCPLEGGAWPTPTYEVQRVVGPEQLAFFNADQEAPLLVPAELADASLRQFYVQLDGRAAAWGRTIGYDDVLSYVAGLHTADAYRRRGLARALMQHLLNDSVAVGYRHSVLTATEMAHELYLALGYRDLATLVMFEPDR